MRRRKMVSVDLHPDNHPDPVPRFCMECLPIFTLYTEGLRASPVKIEATASWLRVFPQTESPEEPFDGWVDLGNGVRMERDEPVDNFGFGEGVRALVDDSILSARSSDKAELYLDWLHSVLLTVAHWRAWDVVPLQNARQYCLDRELRAHFESSPKRAPDRKHKALLSLDIDNDGWRHLAVVIHNNKGAIVGSSAQKLQPALDVGMWRGIGKKLRWVSAEEVRAPNNNVTSRLDFLASSEITAVVGRHVSEMEDVIGPDGIDKRPVAAPNNPGLATRGRPESTALDGLGDRAIAFAERLTPALADVNKKASEPSASDHFVGMWLFVFIDGDGHVPWRPVYQRYLGASATGSITIPPGTCGGRQIDSAV